MPVIELTTRIIAPQERVFDLARCIQAHEKSAGATRERAIGGFTKGLINLNDEVTWEARHFGIRQKLTVRITKFSRPGYFQDVIISGAFKKMVHDHSFNSEGTTTVMIDRFEFESPLGLLGKIVDLLVLKSYMRRFLVRRNGWLKQLAESNDWESYLKAA